MTDTKYDGSYWSEKGKYQEEYELLETLIPSEGHAKNIDVDLVVMGSNIYYEVHNNGGCNFNNPRFLVYLDTIEGYGIDLGVIRQLQESGEVIDHDDECDPIYKAEEPDFDEACKKCDDIMDELIERVDPDIIEECRDLKEAEEDKKIEESKAKQEKDILMNDFH